MPVFRFSELRRDNYEPDYGPSSLAQEQRTAIKQLFNAGNTLDEVRRWSGVKMRQLVEILGVERVVRRCVDDGYTMKELSEIVPEHDIRAILDLYRKREVGDGTCKVE